MIGTLGLKEKVDLIKWQASNAKINLDQIQKRFKSRRSFTRKFDKIVYNKTLWLCSCDETSFILIRLFTVWRRSKVNEKWSFWSETFKGQNKKNIPLNIKNLVSFLLLQEVNIAPSLSSAYAKQINNHNGIVKKKIILLSKIIDILKLWYMKPSSPFI